MRPGAPHPPPARQPCGAQAGDRERFVHHEADHGDDHPSTSTRWGSSRDRSAWWARCSRTFTALGVTPSIGNPEPKRLVGLACFVLGVSSDLGDDPLQIGFAQLIDFALDWPHRFTDLPFGGFARQCHWRFLLPDTRRVLYILTLSTRILGPDESDDLVDLIRTGVPPIFVLPFLPFQFAGLCLNRS